VDVKYFCLSQFNGETTSSKPLVVDFRKCVNTVALSKHWSDMSTSGSTNGLSLNASFERLEREVYCTFFLGSVACHTGKGGGMAMGAAVGFCVGKQI